MGLVATAMPLPFEGSRARWSCSVLPQSSGYRNAWASLGRQVLSEDATQRKIQRGPQEGEQASSEPSWVRRGCRDSPTGPTILLQEAVWGEAAPLAACTIHFILCCPPKPTHGILTPIPVLRAQH